MNTKFKVTKLFLLVLLLLSISNIYSVQAVNQNHLQVYLAEDDGLEAIQERIDDAMELAFEGDYEKINLIEQNLVDQTAQPTKSQNLDYYYKYWMGYLSYNKSMALIKHEKSDEAKQYVEKSIASLTAIDQKDSEVYALLASATSFYFQFIPRQEFMVYFKKVSDYLGKTLETGPNNLRAYYVNATYDFYTPKEYGGGQKTEALLLKAIKLMPKINESPFAPTWGLDLSFDLLINYYVSNENKEKAEEFLTVAQKKFPDNDMFDKWDPVVRK